MGIFFRRRDPSPAAWQPPTPPHCACARHLDDALLARVVPFGVALEMDDEPAATVAEVLGPGGLSVRPATPDDQPSEAGDVLTWNLGVYDDARVHYDDTEDGAGIDLAEGLLEHPGIDRVEWIEREVFLLAAPTLCAEGVLAAAAVTLLDDRVRAAR